MQVGANKRLLGELTQQMPSYDWQALPREDRDLTGFDIIKIPKPSETINYKKRGEQHVKGRGRWTSPCAIHVSTCLSSEDGSIGCGGSQGKRDRILRVTR